MGVNVMHTWAPKKEGEPRRAGKGYDGVLEGSADDPATDFHRQDS